MSKIYYVKRASCRKGDLFWMLTAADGDTHTVVDPRPTSVYIHAHPHIHRSVYIPRKKACEE